MMMIRIQTTPAKLDEKKLTTMMMIKKYGYIAEEHKVHTEDGYILQLHRMLKNHDGKTHTKNYPVLIPSVLLGSSAVWVLRGPDRSLPMQLADDGFDVWLANYRGNTYSRTHETLSEKKSDYWNFSLHELGVFDMPAIIDFILNTTNTNQVHFIGFSLSTAIFFIFASEKQGYLDKIRSNISLAPVVFMHNSTSLLKTFGPMSKKINKLCNVIGHGRFLTHTKILEFIMETVCRAKISRKLLCLKMFINVAFGKDTETFDEEFFSLISGHYPAGTSSKLMAHFSQFITTDNFGQYNYGHKKNLHYYKSKNPPTYHIRSTNVPTFLFYANNDLLTNQKDVDKLYRQLPNVKDVIKVQRKYFNHLGFIFSKTVNQEINIPVRNILMEMDIKRQKNKYRKTRTKEIYIPVNEIQQNTDTEKVNDLESPFKLSRIIKT